jgi:hypothetical protein
MRETEIQLPTLFFIEPTFSLLNYFEVQKPDYFNANRYSMGAHITIFYPEENITLKKADLNIVHYFTVKELAITELHEKHYYLLTVDAPSLIELRAHYGLGEKLFFKNHLIDLHITIAIKDSVHLRNDKANIISWNS